nr:hypothetical protein Iba_chr06aCG19650 [Ipomoea batatas]
MESNTVAAAAMESEVGAAASMESETGAAASMESEIGVAAPMEFGTDDVGAEKPEATTGRSETAAAAAGICSPLAGATGDGRSLQGWEFVGVVFAGQNSIGSRDGPKLEYTLGVEAYMRACMQRASSTSLMAVAMTVVFAVPSKCCDDGVSCSLERHSHSPRSRVCKLSKEQIESGSLERHSHPPRYRVCKLSKEQIESDNKPCEMETKKAGKSYSFLLATQETLSICLSATKSDLKSSNTHPENNSFLHPAANLATPGLLGSFDDGDHLFPQQRRSDSPTVGTLPIIGLQFTLYQDSVEQISY